MNGIDAGTVEFWREKVQGIVDDNLCRVCSRPMEKVFRGCEDDLICFKCHDWITEIVRHADASYPSVVAWP